MKSFNIALITPIHRPMLSDLELLRLRISLSLNQEYDHFFVVPNLMPISEIALNFPASIIVEMPEFFFASKNNYSLLMLNQDFYRRFDNYVYLLILQTDAFLLRNITPLLQYSYDYIGAPFWPTVELREFVGGKIRYPSAFNRLPLLTRKVILEGFNGGLSLRKVATFKDIIEKMNKDKNTAKLFSLNQLPYQEDIFYSLYMKSLDLQIPTRSSALGIFHDSMPLHSIKIREITGFHALFRQSPALEKNLLSHFSGVVAESF